MNGQKPDADQIIAHVQHLRTQPWLSKSQKWWPEYLFHFSDLTNAVNILKKGQLLCRSELEETGQLATDIASPDIISATSLEWKMYVRLYFRPRTPTQYSNEGFRPLNERVYGGAHCPVPVLFIFSSKPILIASETRFSQGNLGAAQPIVGDTAVFFKTLPFEQIYFERSNIGLSSSEKRAIIDHKNAEVIVPSPLDLSNLRAILCRSQAEFETLIYLLPPDIYDSWADKIGVRNDLPVFFSDWSFVERVDLSSSEISFHFNAISKTPGPFHARLEIQETFTGKMLVWKKDDFYAQERLSFSLSILSHPESYVVKLLLDGQLAYENNYLENDGLPF
ncbi:MAG: hypothetical protein ACI8V2_003496 [Candidatus Latescibacterota bacterium]|jgi:hypothetical protein